jgi:hypothetical protein
VTRTSRSCSACRTGCRCGRATLPSSLRSMRCWRSPSPKTRKSVSPPLRRSPRRSTEHPEGESTRVSRRARNVSSQTPMGCVRRTAEVREE